MTIRTTKNNVLSQLKDRLFSELDQDTATRINDFAERFFHTSSASELAQTPLDNLYGMTLSSWEFLQSFDGTAPRVRVFNPNPEQYGWHSNHTVIQLLFKDMPFLVDSVRMELNRQQAGIHVIHSAVLRNHRKDCKLQAAGGEEKAESCMYLEIDRHTDEDWMKQLGRSLAEVQLLVAAAVNDYQAMTDRTRELQAMLAKQKGPQAQEAARFLGWLLEDNFTFLAADELDFDEANGQLTARRIAGHELGTLKRESAAIRKQVFNALSDNEQSSMRDTSPLQLVKYSKAARVHRPAYLDTVVVKKFDAEGRVCGEHRLFGLYTAPVYTSALDRIPMVSTRFENVVANSGFSRHGHAGKALIQILHELPRDEVFLSSEAELLDLALGVFNLQERRMPSLLTRKDSCGKFLTFLYFLPRDSFNTEQRLRVQRLLAKHLKTQEIEFTTHYSESILTRVYFVARVDSEVINQVDFQALEDEVIAISRSWSDDLAQALVTTCGEEHGSSLANRFRNAFPSAYQQHFTPLRAVGDVQRLAELTDSKPIGISFYHLLEEPGNILHFKLFNSGTPLVLSDMIPVLEQLGMCVLGEHPYRVQDEQGQQYWIHDFNLRYQHAESVDLDQVRTLFQDAFTAIWNGQAESDPFNQLVIGAGLDWREVAMLRAYARYNQQIRFGFSQSFIASALTRHLQVSRLLVALFRARFEPSRQKRKAAAVAERIETSILEALDKIENLNDDQVLRRYLELILATLRTSYFQRNAQGQLKDYVSYKINPHAIADIPLPRPMFEVFVYSPRVEGVHLRGGKVARGGLRWSDRLEDYRTEVLGLVKAQQVKNAVIVPVGAKGGFVAKQLPEGGSREDIQVEGIASYRIFISALLDITDNLQGGDLVPPSEVVRHDGDDPYFVVAADKGTATFSDIANSIAEERGFWLGDAFASGGSQGYDHKGMGITARGAWESVKQHFRELGLNTQTDDFTVVGIGDMAGDVFGNGMLLSEHICLVGAFNHLHIFIDPTPDAAASYQERKRLFNLPRSSWEDYNRELISKGGGIFSRAAKWIELTPEIQQRFGVKADRLSPNDLIQAMLKANVDLIWNGGIGTYVKASTETHADVGDKANDSLRINGRDLRCRVLGEGGNLGFTQLGRIEFCQTGGKANTDFIDNAGGVDCSDHEVNIKILLNELVAQGDMTMKQRNTLLRDMTDNVAELVLANNYDQALAISLAQSHARRAPNEYARLIQRLEQQGRLNRSLEFLPDDDALAELEAKGASLTRPELSVLISYAKAEIKESLIDSDLINDPYLRQQINTAFPQELTSRYQSQAHDHRLRREILATQLANGLVNHVGITFFDQIIRSTGAVPTEVVRAYILARDVFSMADTRAAIKALDNQVDAAVQQQMLADLNRLMRRATRWFIRTIGEQQDLGSLIEQYQQPVSGLISALPGLLCGSAREATHHRQSALTEAGVPKELANRVAATDSLYALLGIVRSAIGREQSLLQTSEVYFALGETLKLQDFDERIRSMDVDTHWQAVAREGIREELTRLQQAITEAVLSERAEADANVSDTVSTWLARQNGHLSRWQTMSGEIVSQPTLDISMASVAVRELRDLSNRL